MRTDKELLELVLEKLEPEMLKHPWKVGLCYVISHLSQIKIIDFDEYERIEEIIYDNPTERFLYDIYFFPPGEIEPRKEYLKQLIKKYENT